MNLVSVIISISIMSIVALGSLQSLNNQFKGNATAQVLTDVNSFVNNAKTSTQPVNCFQSMGFCYTGDTTASDGQTYMMFKITRSVFGPKIVQRLKPIVYVPPTNTNTDGCDGHSDNGNHYGEYK